MFKNKYCLIISMNCNRRRLNTAAMATLLATGIAAFSAFGQKGDTLRRCQPYTDGVIEDVRVDTASIKLINSVYACTTISDLKGRMPEIIQTLETMGKGKNVEGIVQAYSAVGEHFRYIVSQTFIRSNRVGMDAAQLGGVMLDSASSKKEALAWVFLSLNRLTDRPFSWPGNPGLGPRSRAAENYFFTKLRARLPGMEEAIKKDWYTPDCLPPTEDQMRSFFAYFCTAF